MADNEFSCYGGRPRLQCGISGEDDPAKVKHLDSIMAAKNRQPFTWRKVLGIKNEDKKTQWVIRKQK